MTVTIKRESYTGLRTYYLKVGKSMRPVKNIHFYRREGDIVFKTKGWFEPIINGISHDRDPAGLTVGDLRRANKVDLTRGGNFWVSTGTKTWSEAEIDVYVEIGLDVVLGEPKVVELYSNTTGTTFHTIRDLTATFGPDGVKTITIAIPESVYTVQNDYGKAARAVDTHLEGDSLTLEKLCADEALFKLIVQARSAYAGERLKQTPKA